MRKVLEKISFITKISFNKKNKFQPKINKDMYTVGSAGTAVFSTKEKLDAALEANTATLDGNYEIGSEADAFVVGHSLIDVLDSDDDTIVVRVLSAGDAEHLSEADECMLNTNYFCTKAMLFASGAVKPVEHV